MRLSLIIKSHKGSPRTGGRTVLPPTGGTIGRSPDNDVVLPDPERFVSGCHARVRAQGDDFYLDDLSRNGVFLNGAVEPLGRTRSALLRGGDVIAVGEYELLVELEAQPESVPVAPPVVPASAPPRSPVSVSDRPLDPLELLGGEGRPREDPRAGAQPDHVPPESRHFEPPRVRADPSAPAQPPPGRSSAGSSAIPDDWDLTGKATPAPPEAAPVPPDVAAPAVPADIPRDGLPASGGQIPDDWDRTGMSKVASPPVAATALKDSEAPAAKPLPDDWDLSLERPAPPAAEPPPVIPESVEIAEMEPGSESPAPTTSAGFGDVAPDDFVRRLVQAAGIAESGAVPADFAPAVGALLVGLANGFVELLAARTSFKNELRMEATGIRPAENNPLKFAADGSDALQHLLFPRGGGFTPAEEAVQEAVRDLQSHQVAMISAMRAALDALLKRLDPDALEARCDEEPKSRLGLGGKGRYWDAYRQLMAGLQEDPDAFFKEMFAEEFVRAYEQQIALLSKDRR